MGKTVVGSYSLLPCPTLFVFPSVSCRKWSGTHANSSLLCRLILGSRAGAFSQMSSCEYLWHRKGQHSTGECRQKQGRQQSAAGLARKLSLSRFKDASFTEVLKISIWLKFVSRSPPTQSLIKRKIFSFMINICFQGKLQNSWKSKIYLSAAFLLPF